MVSRTTDDYVAMALAGCEAICEPAFWAGFDRASEKGFYDYFRQITDYEPRRAAKFGLKHYSWLCINPKEAEDVSLAEAVLALIPEFIDQPNVLGIGEIGREQHVGHEKNRSRERCRKRHQVVGDTHDRNSSTQRKQLDASRRTADRETALIRNPGCFWLSCGEESCRTRLEPLATPPSSPSRSRRTLRAMPERGCARVASGGWKGPT